jgi:competence protein ComEA
MTDINLAAYLIDGTTLTIPGEPEEHAGVIRRPSAPPPNPAQYTVSGWQAGGGGPATDSASGSRSNGSGGIDLNRASAAELETLPGIGPKLAGEIIRFRDQQPFRSVDDLDLVSGIGPKRLEAVRGLVTVAR